MSLDNPISRYPKFFQSQNHPSLKPWHIFYKQHSRPQKNEKYFLIPHAAKFSILPFRFQQVLSNHSANLKILVAAFLCFVSASSSHFRFDIVIRCKKYNKNQLFKLKCNNHSTQVSKLNEMNSYEQPWLPIAFSRRSIRMAHLY